MQHSIEYTKQAIKVLASMPRNQRALVESKVEVLARDPSGAANVRKLVGESGYRLRVGDWRVIYDLESERLIVRVLRVGPRGGVYR